MMISSVTSSVVPVNKGKNVDPVGTGHQVDGFGPGYQVDLSVKSSAVGVALRSPASGAIEAKVRNVLTRVLMETLFGQDTNTKESSEEELVREVALDPVMEEQMRPR